MVLNDKQTMTVHKQVTEAFPSATLVGNTSDIMPLSIANEIHMYLKIDILLSDLTAS